MSKRIGKSDQASRVKQLIAGTNKHYSNASQPLAFGGATYTATALTALLQSFVDLRQAVDDAAAAHRTKVAAEAAQAPHLRGVISAFVAYVKATFGNSPDDLADFGILPRKATTPQTAGQKAAAVAKRAGTRAARHTMGANQKKTIKGGPVTVTITSTPVSDATHAVSSSSSAPIAPPAAPAPAGGAAGTAPAGGSTQRA
jgi:hypothetical protein